MVDGAAKKNAISGEFQILEEGIAVAVKGEVEVMESKAKKIMLNVKSLIVWLWQLRMLVQDL